MAILTIQELIDDRLTSRLGMIQKVEGYNHLCKHLSSTTVLVPYLNWIATPLVKQNGTIITPTSIDSDTGIITITGLAAGDDITADYTFAYFSDTDLTNFLRLAMAKFNLAPPISYFSYNTATTSANYPEAWTDVLVAYAYKLCLETILVDLMAWKAKIIWTDPIGIAGILQGIIAGIDSYIAMIMPNVKGRNYLTPRGVSIGSFALPATVSDQNWQMWTAVRA